MSLAAALVIAIAATLGVGVALFAFTRGSEGRGWAIELARAIVLSRLRRLPPEHRDRYREEYEADLDQLRERPATALIHALQAAARTGALSLTFQDAAPLPHDRLARRALAHLGVPVRLSSARAEADASYIFGGAMRRRR